MVIFECQAHNIYLPFSFHNSKGWARRHEARNPKAHNHLAKYKNGVVSEEESQREAKNETLAIFASW